MLGLRYDTPEGWASRALEEPGALLLDHLFCEQKAAAMAMAIARRHGEGKPSLVKLMEELAAEEEARRSEYHEKAQIPTPSACGASSTKTGEPASSTS